MKKFIVMALAMLSLSAFAGQKMSADAVELFSVLNHPTVRDCLERASVNLMFVSIDKQVARCPLCNTYTITGSERNIDTPSVEKTKITIVGKGVPGTWRGFVQTYTCDVKVEARK